jgi:hypothetical protein
MNWKKEKEHQPNKRESIIFIEYSGKIHAGIWEDQVFFRYDEDGINPIHGPEVEWWIALSEIPFHFTAQR